MEETLKDGSIVYEEKEELEREYVFKFNTVQEGRDFMKKIHDQLVGNEDYIENRIILNNLNDWDEVPTVYLYIFKDCKNIPTFSI